MRSHKGAKDFGNSPRCQQALDSAVKSVARVFGCEDEFETFLRARDITLRHLNDPSTDSPLTYEEYKKSIPYWVAAIESPLYRLYEAGLSDERAAHVSKHRKASKKKKN